MESLAEANRSLPRVPEGRRFAPGVVARAMAALAPAQALNAATHAVHAAGFWQEGAPLLLREDVGRHNALDKLMGAMASTGLDMGMGAVVVTSRASYEMVQKTATMGIGILAAISAPTMLAIRMAEALNLTLVGFARHNSHVLYAGADRILPEVSP
jgi:FdhD protein